jgi:adenosine deaminase CECR1
LTQATTEKDMDQLSIQDEADAQWLQERGVPSLQEPFLQKYLQGRDALVDQEKKQRSGSS